MPLMTARHDRNLRTRTSPAKRCGTGGEGPLEIHRAAVSAGTTARPAEPLQHSGKEDAEEFRLQKLKMQRINWPTTFESLSLTPFLCVSKDVVLYFALPTHVEGCSSAIRHPARRAVAHCSMPCAAGGRVAVASSSR